MHPASYGEIDTEEPQYFFKESKSQNIFRLRKNTFQLGDLGSPGCPVLASHTLRLFRIAEEKAKTLWGEKPWRTPFQHVSASNSG